MTCKTNVATRASGTSSALTVALLIGFALTASSTAARAGIEPVNLALGKYAFQSSTLFGADAGRAVDGNADYSLRLQCDDGGGETAQQRCVGFAHIILGGRLTACWAARGPAACGCRGRSGC